MLTPSKIRELCQKYMLNPSKSYGQHYLITDAPINKMIAAANLTPEDTVIEIGPGFGILTFALAPQVKQVIAYEIEQKLRPYWEEKELDYGNISVIWGDVLKQWGQRDKDGGEFPISNFQLPKSYKVIANLPYQITSDVLRMLLESDPAPELIVVMVQKEVAERMCAKPGEMSLLSLSVQYYGDAKMVTRVAPGCFWPAPKVDSAVVSIKIKEQGAPLLSGISLSAAGSTRSKEQNDIRESGIPARRSSQSEDGSGYLDHQAFFRVARAGFAQKRKQLWHNLVNGLHLSPEVVKQALVKVTGNEKVRAEDLSVEDWKELVREFVKFVKL